MNRVILNGGIQLDRQFCGTKFECSFPNGALHTCKVVHTCLAIDPTNPNFIYAGTGEGFSNVDAIRGAGIFRTTDGSSWAQLPSTAGASFQYINRLAVSADGKILLAATPLGIWRSDDPNRVTWDHVSTIPMADIDFSPTSSKNAIAGGLSNGQSYYSTDGGKTWKAGAHTTPWSGRVEVTYARKDPKIVYASVQMNNGGEIWRSGDGGKSYARRNTQLANGNHASYLGDQGWYGNSIWAGDPKNSDLVIVGGLDLYRSTDGGNILIDISTWWDTRSAHADHHAIVSHASYNGTTNKTVYFGNDGGIFQAADVTTVGNDPKQPRVKGWQELNNTYGVTQFYGGAGNPKTGTIVGGAQDNGTIRFTPAGGSEQWSEMFGGDGGTCAADPTDSKYFYGEYVYLNICRSVDGGATADYISGQFWDGSQWTWKPIPYRITDAMNQRALFIAPFVLDPNNSNRILGGGVSLWRTNNARAANTNNTGPVWTAIKGSVGGRISAIAIASGASDLIWVGYDDGQVFKTTSGTQTNLCGRRWITPAAVRLRHRVIAPPSQSIPRRTTSCTSHSAATIKAMPGKRRTAVRNGTTSVIRFRKHPFVLSRFIPGRRIFSISAPKSACSRARMPELRGARPTKVRPIVRWTICSG